MTLKCPCARTERMECERDDSAFMLVAAHGDQLEHVGLALDLAVRPQDVEETICSLQFATRVRATELGSASKNVSSTSSSSASSDAAAASSEPAEKAEKAEKPAKAAVIAPGTAKRPATATPSVAAAKTAHVGHRDAGPNSLQGRSGDRGRMKFLAGSGRWSGKGSSGR